MVASTTIEEGEGCNGCINNRRGGCNGGLNNSRGRGGCNGGLNNNRRGRGVVIVASTTIEEGKGCNGGLLARQHYSVFKNSRFCATLIFKRKFPTTKLSFV